MKKSIIAAGASAAALAAMPIVGVFAASGNSFTDHLTVNVNAGCTIENADTIDDGDSETTEPAKGTYTDRSFSATIATGTIGYLNVDTSQGTPDDTTAPAASAEAPAFTISCNAGAPADPSDPQPGEIAAWTIGVQANNLTSTGNTPIAPGTTFSGNTSAYGIKSNATATGGEITSNPYASYTYVSNNDGLFLGADNGVTVTFNPSYKVYVSPQQGVGAYNGDVVYTVTQP